MEWVDDGENGENSRTEDGQKDDRKQQQDQEVDTEEFPKEAGGKSMKYGTG